MKIRSILTASAALLALAPLGRAIAAPATKTADAAADIVPSQLPRNAAPLHYAITVTPDAEKLTFDGNVHIEFMLKTPSDSVTLNAADIDFRTVTIAKGRAAALPVTTQVNATAQTATLSFGQTLPAGRYTLYIDYAGKILQQANGLFALDYKNPEGAEKRALPNTTMVERTPQVRSASSALANSSRKRTPRIDGPIRNSVSVEASR